MEKSSVGHGWYGRKSPLLLAVMALASAVGCEGGSNPIADMQPQVCEARRQRAPDFAPMLDLLFVIDTSPAMAEAQPHLETNLRRMATVLEQIQGGLPDIHLGVVSADLGAGGYDVAGCAGTGDGGRLQTSPRVDGCSPPEGSFLYSYRTPSYQCPSGQSYCPEHNYEGDLGDALTCVGMLGADGCAFPQPLEAMKRALTHPDNAGFLRDEAFLFVVFLTASDDCSAADSGLFDPNAADLGAADAFRCTRYGVTCDGGEIDGTPQTYSACQPRTDSLLADPGAYVSFLRGLKADPGQVLVAAAAGPEGPFTIVSPDPGQPRLAPSCTSDAASAKPAVRLQAFLDAFPYRSTSTSLCEEDLSGTLILVAQQLAWVLEDPCLPEGLDTTDLDPAAPGLQPACSVALVDGITGAAVQDIQPCRMAEPNRPAADTPVPCWWVDESTSSDCPFAEVEGLTPANTVGMTIEWRCAAACSDGGP